MKKSVPFRRSILVNVTVGVLLTGGCLLLLSLWATNQAVEKLSGALTKRVIATTDARLQGFFEPVQVAIEVTAERASTGEFENFPRSALDRYFAPLVRRVPHLSSLSYAHANGDEYMLMLVEETWRSRHSRPQTWGNSAEWREWVAGARGKSAERRTVDYDARTRPWFQGALSRFEELGPDAPLRQRIHWTEPYKFFTSGEPGLTASLAHQSVNGQTIVLGFDILLSEISKFTTRLEVGERGKAFVLRGQPDKPAGLVVVGLPADDRFQNEEVMVDFVLSPPDDLGGPVASFVAALAKSKGAPPGAAIPFVHEGERWWGALDRSQLRSTVNIWVGSVMPESELLAGIPRTNLIVILITALILGLAVRRSFLVAQRYAQPIEELTESGNRMQRLNFEPAVPVESHITEIRGLSSALESMRGALQTFSAAREDVRVAKTIRAMTQPATTLAIGALDICAWHQPALEVGGEVYDMRGLPADGGVAIGYFDCPGTGVSAAVYGNQLRAAFRAAVASDADPRTVAVCTERFLTRDLPGAIPVHAWFLRLAGSPTRLEALGLGVDSLVLKQDGQLKQIESAGHSLGLPREQGMPAAATLTLQFGDVLVLASDGVLDALGPDRRRFGVEGLRRALQDIGDVRAEQLVDSLRATLEDYPPTPSGDRTLLVIKVGR